MAEEPAAESRAEKGCVPCGASGRARPPCGPQLLSLGSAILLVRKTVRKPNPVKETRRHAGLSPLFTLPLSLKPGPGVS